MIINRLIRVTIPHPCVIMEAPTDLRNETMSVETPCMDPWSGLAVALLAGGLIVSLTRMVIDWLIERIVCICVN